MKKVLLQALVVLWGLGGLHALFDCPKSLVEKAGKAKATIKDKAALRKCVTPDMETKNPNFTEALVKACDGSKFKKAFSKQCAIAAKAADPDGSDSSSGGASDDDGSSSKSGGSSNNGGNNSGGGQDSSSGGTTCTCICPGSQAPAGYAPQPPAYDPYGQQQQQQQQQYQQPGYGY